MQQKVRVEGLKELERALRLLPRATGKNVLKRTLMKAGRPIERMAESRAPRLSGHLKRSIEVSTKLSRYQRSLNRKQSPVEVYVGAGPLPQAHMVEFGSAHNTAKAFMCPAWDSGGRRSLAIIRRTLAAEIQKAAARLARKAARAAR